MEICISCVRLLLISIVFELSSHFELLISICEGGLSRLMTFGRNTFLLSLIMNEVSTMSGCSLKFLGKVEVFMATSEDQREQNPH